MLTSSVTSSTNLVTQTTLTQPEPNNIYGFNGYWVVDPKAIDGGGIELRADRFLPNDAKATANDPRIMAQTATLSVWKSFTGTIPAHTANTMVSEEVILKGGATLLGSSFAFLGAITATTLLSF